MSETKKEIVSKNKLMEAGVYFGTRKSQWNPRMKPYIVATKKGVHIIDIQKTKRTLEFAYNIVRKFAEKGANFIFVGTKKQAKETIKENALRTNSFYVSERWLGGTLTNNRTIFRRVRRMFDLEKLAENNFEGYTKKEGVLFQKELDKLQKNLNGIREMRYRPNVMIVADPIGDLIAVKEAQRLGIKVIGVVDTNVDPTIVDIAIPANDDSVKSLSLIITILADAIVAAKNGAQKWAYQSDEAISLPEELVPEWKIKREKRREAFAKRRASREFKNKDSKDFSKKDDSNANKSETKLVDEIKVEESDIKQPEEKSTEPVEKEKTSSEDLSKKTVVELKELLKAAGKPVSGTKAELIERLGA